MNVRTRALCMLAFALSFDEVIVTKKAAEAK